MIPEIGSFLFIKYLECFIILCKILKNFTQYNLYYGIILNDFPVFKKGDINGQGQFKYQRAGITDTG